MPKYREHFLDVHLTLVRYTNVADEFELSTIPFAIAIERKPPEFNLGPFLPSAAEPNP